jgi:hypothetical protein
MDREPQFDSVSTARREPRAAVLLTGTMDERPFRDALQHLQRCRDDAKTFDPADPPPELHPKQTLVVHVEAGIALKPLPWHVHLRPSSTTYEKEMRPPGAAWLYMHGRGVLRPHGPRPVADAAYSGTLTALNFTEYHPAQGIPADWNGADYVVEQHGQIFRLVERETTQVRTPSQAVIRIDSIEDPVTVGVSEDPRPRRKRIPSPSQLIQADPEFLEFFTPGSVKGGKLVRSDYQEIREVSRLRRSEVGNLTEDDLLSMMSYARTPLLEVASNERNDGKSPFIYRAKFKLS